MQWLYMPLRVLYRAVFCIPKSALALIGGAGGSAPLCADINMAAAAAACLSNKKFHPCFNPSEASPPQLSPSLSLTCILTAFSAQVIQHEYRMCVYKIHPPLPTSLPAFISIQIIQV